MDKQQTAGILAEFQDEFVVCWRQLPNKAFFFALLAAWLILFHFLGNSTLGYVNTSSLFGWMYDAYWQPESPDSHGLLVPALVLALLYVKRKELLAVRISAWWPGLFVFAGAALLHILAYWVQQPRISVVALFAGIWGLMGLAWGPQWLRTSLFPYFLVAFCVPLGSLADPLSFRLRLVVAKFVTVISQVILGIDVVRDGTKLISGAGNFEYEVAAACAGLRSLVATLALATIYAFLAFPKFWKRAVLILSAFPLAVVGNVFRMLTIVIAAEFGGQRAGSYVHEGGPLGILSLLPYVPAFAGLLLIGRWLEHSKSRSSSSPKAGGP